MPPPPLFLFLWRKDLSETCDLVIRSFAVLHWKEEILDPTCSERSFVFVEHCFWYVRTSATSSGNFAVYAFWDHLWNEPEKNVTVTTLQDISGGNENKNFMHKKYKDNLTVLEARVNLLIFACQADICFLKMCKK